MSTETLGRVVGRNVRNYRLDDEASLEDIARAARNLELNWAHTRVSAIEKGTREPKLQTLIALATILGRPLSDLLATDAEWIDLGDLMVQADQLRLMFTKRIPRPEPSNAMSMDEWVASRGWGSEHQMYEGLGVRPEMLRELARRNGLADQRAAASLGIDIDVLNTICFHDYSRTFGEERAMRAAERRWDLGHAAVVVREELRARVAELSLALRNPTAFGPDEAQP